LRTLPNLAEAGLTQAPSRIAGLSSAGLAHVAAFPATTPVTELAFRLYLYNRLPLSPALSRSFPDEEAITVGLLGGDQFLPAELEKNWQERSVVRSGRLAWRSWKRRSERGGRPGPVTHKLYVSPSLRDTPVAFRETLAVLGSSAASAVKVGRSLDALLRPDKLVAYFGGLAGLLEAAASLEQRLAGVSAHGVPFTCAIGSAGLLSWGMDPPDDLSRLGASWRMLVTGQLAAGMRAGVADTPEGRAMAARQRVEQLGIDPETWRPGDRTWELLRNEGIRGGD
jgi:hypothetical protein